jgi:tRNA-2-methylthio-N6-dimethylallyladenosine synthase
MTDDLLQAVRDLPKACRYLHVPAQHGHNAMLKRMKRLYTVEFYQDMISRAREAIPDVAISSDFIVGFCGETEDEFATCGELIRLATFKNSYIFKYSPRPGTKAHELFEDDVPEEIKKRRNNDLLAVQAEISLADHQRQLGKTVEVLVEGPSKAALRNGEQSIATGMTQLTGRTMTDHIVVFNGHTRLIGQTVTVQINEVSSWTMFGVVETNDGITSTGNQAVTESHHTSPSTHHRKRIKLQLASPA